MSCAGEDSARGQVLLIVLIVIVAFGVAGYLVYRWWQSRSPPEPVRVLECSLDPAEVKAGQSSTLTVTLENLDKRTHTIKLYFSADPKVSFIKPNGEPLERNDSSFTYTFVLESAQSTSVLQFLVSGKLSETVSFAGYPIYLEILVDGERISKSWQDLTLTIRKD